MTSARSNARIEEWLTHQDFLRRTLRGLLNSEADVEDALQDTWARLLERPATAPAAPRGWLTRVTRNTALSGLRARRRRSDHETAARSAGAADSPADSVARMEAMQRVAQALLALEEPYRSVVLLRHEQDLAVATIARQLGRSEGTVRSQLSRAHELLRQKLDREFGGRERWALLAAPMVLRSGIPLAPIAALLVALAGGAGWWWWSERAAEPRPPALAAAPDPEPAPAPAVVTLPAREALLEPAPTLVEPPGSVALSAPTSNERLLPPIELLDRVHYDDYMRATFSFQHGLRDDPDNKLTRNDWDLLFARGTFRVRMVVSDASFVADLGPLAPLTLDGVTLAERELGEHVPTMAGHSYFLWSIDDDTDLAGLVVVREHEVGKRCLLDWYATDGSGRAQGSLADDGVGEPLTMSLARLRSEARASLGLLARPEVLFQARMGAGGGNENRVNMNRSLRYMETLESAPLDLTGEIGIQEPARAYLEGGPIPDGRNFVVTGASWSGRALGDSNGRGLLTLVVGGETLFRSETTPEPIFGNWAGAIVLAPGDESRTYLGVANSSAGEARLFGHFAEATEVRSWSENAGFLTTVAPVTPPEPTLTAPRVVLQARAGHQGGNPVSLTLHGQTSIYVDRVEAQPLDLSQAPGDHDPALVHLQGGHVPEGQAFVVTRAQWWSAAYDESGHSLFLLTVAGEVLARREGHGPPETGSWSGRLVVLPGEESRTSLEVSYFAAGDVLLTGHFEPAPR